MQLKIGSLFDGIGGFPLVSSWYGIEPVWASEIEAVPVSITKRHFPNMKHLGDITKINGAEIEPVDIITFGSPCQDLSVAGNRAGLAGTRSGLFGEAIRIIEEMRKSTNERYPTWAVWENVPGAFSSNDGMDFRSVLQSFANTEIPMPSNNRWASAGLVRGGSCDFGWRVLDAQFWGVPQRRKRIFLVADFGGQRAVQVLFKPESLRRNIKTSGKPWERFTENFKGNVGSAGFNGRAGAKAGLSFSDEITPTLLSQQESHVLVFDCRGNGDGAIVNTLTGDHQNRVTDYTAICITEKQNHVLKVAAFDTTQITSKTNASKVEYGLPCHTLNLNAHPPAICLAGNTIGRELQSGGNGPGFQEEASYTLTATDQHAVLANGKTATGTLMANAGTKLWLGNQEAFSGDYSIIQNQLVRRLTPLECERLQGFPDCWTLLDVNGKEVSDSARYKALGNSLALPCVDYIISGICEVLLHDN